MLKNLETIHEQALVHLETYFTRILETFSNTVDSIYVYGSVVTKDFIPEQSDVNSLVLFDRFSFQDTRRMQPIVSSGLKKRVAAPLCLSVETFMRSADTFPLEFIEIKDTHRCLYGGIDRVLDLEIPRELLRVKIEEQIKGKLIRLRQIVMEQGENPKQLIEVVMDAQRQLFPVFRNLLRFLGVESPPVGKDEVLKELENRCQFNVLACRRVWEHIGGRSAIPLGEAVSVYGGYIDVLFQLGQVIDRLEHR